MPTTVVGLRLGGGRAAAAGRTPAQPERRWVGYQSRSAS